MRSRTETVVVRPPERNGFVDLTEELFRAVKDAGVTDGCAVVFCAHTTAALLINEWEDGALEDFRARLEALVPAEVAYAHDDLTRRTWARPRTPSPWCRASRCWVAGSASCCSSWTSRRQPAATWSSTSSANDGPGARPGAVPARGILRARCSTNGAGRER